MAVIRTAQIEDALAIAHVHVDTWRTTYGGIIPDEHLANLSYERCQAGWIEHLSRPEVEQVFVVEEPGGAIVAFASGGPIKETLGEWDGELYVLYVLKAFQGLGYGKQLVTHVAQDLARRDFRSMVIWVMKDNPARRFYEKLGGRLIGEQGITIGGKDLLKVAYVWPELAVFR
ncbi:MAG: GNAT family N-acetyltransferase [Anaerolinea sp.]|nr:GNAT family N-acetyltransferase [Anaerolinea sp.]